MGEFSINFFSILAGEKHFSVGSFPVRCAWYLILPRCLEVHHFSSFSSPSLKNPFLQQRVEEAQRKRHQCFVVPVLTVPFDPCLFVEASEGAVSVLERRNSCAFLLSAVLFSLHLRNNL